MFLEANNYDKSLIEDTYTSEIEIPHKQMSDRLNLIIALQRIKLLQGFLNI